MLLLQKRHSNSIKCPASGEAEQREKQNLQAIIRKAVGELVEP